MKTIDAVEVDYLDIVVKGLQENRGQARLQLAADVGMSLRALEYIAERKGDPKYSNVLKLYRALLAKEAAAGK